jgi:GT2 family glycosyltransferase
MPLASVIVATYDRPANLELCLEAYRHQSVRDFEILVADDGSGPATAEVIRAARETARVPIRHFWQEDLGFRKCHILNEAARHSLSPYLIFTDSDCAPERRFVENHLRYRAPGRFLVGRAVKWGEARSRALDRAAIARGDHARVGLRDVWDLLHKRNRNIPYGVHLPGEIGFRLAQRIKKNRSARGANLSLWRSDLTRVNGWNEDFRSWGPEDTELGHRLVLAGLERRTVVFKAMTFHLHHARPDRRDRSARRAYEASKARGIPWCPNGLVKSEKPLHPV